MLYVIDFIVLIGCILVLSAGIVWAFRSSDYNKNPLHRCYQFLSGLYLRISGFQAAGCDALKNGKDELCERAFGSRKMFSAVTGTAFVSGIQPSKTEESQKIYVTRSRQYKRKILK